MISICSQQCKYSMKRQRFCSFISFAQKRGCSYEWKTAKLHSWPKMGSQLFVQWTTQYFSLCQDCHHIPEAFCPQHRDQRIRPKFPEIWEHYQIQCRLEVTSMHAGNRCWQIMTSRPWRTVNQQTRWTRKIQRKAFLFGCWPSQWIQRIWRRMCSHIPLKEWSQIRKVKLQKWRHKRKHSVHAYFRKNQKRSIVRTEKYGDLTTAEHKVLNEGRESRNNHRYAVVIPKDWMRKKSWQPQKMDIFFCGRWFSKIIWKRLRIPRTHSDTRIHRKERESQRRISWREGRVSTWRNKRWWRNQ